MTTKRLPAEPPPGEPPGKRPGDADDPTWDDDVPPDHDILDEPDAADDLEWMDDEWPDDEPLEEADGDWMGEVSHTDDLDPDGQGDPLTDIDDDEPFDPVELGEDEGLAQLELDLEVPVDAEERPILPWQTTTRVDGVEVATILDPTRATSVWFGGTTGQVTLSLGPLTLQAHVVAEPGPSPDGSASQLWLGRDVLAGRVYIAT